MRRCDRLLDAAVGVERRLEEVDVELHAERLQIAILLLAQLPHGEPAHRVEIVAVAGPSICSSM